MPFNAHDLMTFCRTVIRVVEASPESVQRDERTERLSMNLITPPPSLSVGQVRLVVRPDMGYPNMLIRRVAAVVYNFNVSELEDHGGALLAVSDMTKAMARAYLRGSGGILSDLEKIGETNMQLFIDNHKEGKEDG